MIYFKINILKDMYIFFLVDLLVMVIIDVFKVIMRVVNVKSFKLIE